MDNTRMWAYAQRHGCPAKYRWCPLFNSTKFGSRPLLECRAVRFAEVNQTPEPISAVSGPCTILRGHVEKVLPFNKYFSDCRYVPYLERHNPTKLCDGGGAQMANV